ncbi:GTPase RsgA [Faecalicatena contorta]|uniref:GTPase RsgA n=1 Tax=Lachnospiraceae TaxID=186803 RepID=UPI001F418F99|nr:GTPase RsgA [Faecalicatena contorta]MCF2668556.1 GTPase RsgA [Faecalicatena contorta]
MGNEIIMRQYGLSETVEKLAERFADLTVSRILSQEKGVYRLISSQGEKWGEISGRYHYDVQAKSDYPTVGDFVMVDWNKSGGNAVIHYVLPRKSSFIRKAAGEKNEEQVVATNIDTVFLCMSLNNDFNLRRLERYVAIAWNSGAVPVVVLTKGDLCENPDSKLIEVSSRELTLLPSGGMVIDTPGMRELGMWDAGDGIDQTFSDIEKLAQKCRFRDCTHSGSEPGCAVQEAVERGELPIDRLRSYQKLMNENRYVKDTQGYLAEKRQKFKNIAKINKRNRKG